VLITNGAKQAIYNACAAILDPGDEVILPGPYWVTYPESIRLAGGVDVVVPTDESSGFRATVDQLEAARTPRTKALMFVSPSNPTGAVYPRAEVEAVGQWAAEHGIWVITDEIYEHLVYGGAEFTSLPALVPAAAERCIVINGVSKSYAMTGWRVGWMIGPADVIKAATNLQSHATSNVANVSQAAALAALTGDQACVAEMREAFDRRRRLMHTLLNDIDGVTCIEPEGAFYAFPNFTGVLGRDIGGTRPTTTLDLATAVLDQAKVAIVPGEAFGAPGYVRLSYALGDEQLEEGVSRLAKLLTS
jgi:aspartate aminotransferase